MSNVMFESNVNATARRLRGPCSTTVGSLGRLGAAVEVDVDGAGAREVEVGARGSACAWAGAPRHPPLTSAVSTPRQTNERRGTARHAAARHHCLGRLLAGFPDAVGGSEAPQDLP